MFHKIFASAALLACLAANASAILLNDDADFAITGWAQLDTELDITPQDKQTKRKDYSARANECNK